MSDITNELELKNQRIKELELIVENLNIQVKELEANREEYSIKFASMSEAVRQLNERQEKLNGELERYRKIMQGTYDLLEIEKK